MENKEKSKLDYKWYIIFALILTSVVIYFYKNYQISETKREVTVKADSIIKAQNVSLLKAFIKPLIWSTRTEMLKQQIDDLDILNSDLVKEKNILSINVVDINGKIISATNKKLDGAVAPDNYKEFLTLDTIKVDRVNDSLTLVIAPVMGYQSKLGVIILNYRTQNIN
jgi:hypothetical protein